MNQYFNSDQFFKCNDLVTENCLFVSCVNELNVLGCKRNDKAGKIKIKSKLFFKESL